MVAFLKKLVKDCLTENNGESYDVIRVITLLIGGSGWLTFLYKVLSSTAPFDMSGFGTAMCLILAGVCAAAIGVAQKQKTDTQ